jgi:hypothetical protein
MLKYWGKDKELNKSHRLPWILNKTLLKKRVVEKMMISSALH